METDRTCFRMKVILALCEQPLSCPLSITNNHYLTGLPVVNAVYKMSFIFFSEGYFWEVIVGVHRLAHLIFTLFQSNIYKVDVREFLPRDLCSENEANTAMK